MGFNPFLYINSFVLVVLPHLLLSSIKFFFWKEQNFQNWFFHFLNSVYVTTLVLAVFKKGMEDTQEYYKSILTQSFYFSILFFSLRFKYLKEETKDDEEPPNEKLKFIVYFVLIFLALFSHTLYKFSFEEWGKVEFDQIMCNVFTPTKDETGKMYMHGFLKRFLYPTLASSALIALFLIINTSLHISYDYNLRFFKEDDGPSISFPPYLYIIVAFLVKITYTLADFGILDPKKFVYTTIFEDTYVNPGMVTITFPENKRNLILLYVESLENTFLSIEKGGVYNESLLPNLESMYEDPNILYFSDSSSLGGYGNVPLMKWSAAAVFSTQTGLPLKPFFFPNYHSFPCLITMTDLLHINGYNLHYITSTTVQSWGTGLIFNTHETECHGGPEIIKEKPIYKKGIRKDKEIWDIYAYRYMKDKIEELAKDDKPFFVAFDSYETHMPDGYLSPECENLFPNLRHFNQVRRCVDKQTYEFIQWAQSQPFYENTTIVVIGDHLTTGNDLVTYKEVDDQYKRTVFNMIINAPIKKPDTKITHNRKYAPVDWFPTILALMGVNITGERLGMGTNLLSGLPTLTERDPTYINEIEKYSKFYKYEFAGDRSQPLLRFVPLWLTSYDLNETYINQTLYNNSTNITMI